MNIYESLGVTPIINATGTFTRLGGSLMPPEVIDAMAQASRQFVALEELQYRAGKVIAELVGAEAAYEGEEQIIARRVREIVAQARGSDGTD